MKSAVITHAGHLRYSTLVAAPLAPTADVLARLSAQEIVSALGLRAEGWLGGVVSLPFQRLSRRLGRHLAEFDEAVASDVCRAAGVALSRFGVSLQVEGAAAVPSSGAVCI